MKKKLLLVINDIHLGGGGERVASNIANHYVNNGWSVTICSFGKQKQKNIFNLNNRVTVDYLQTTNNKYLKKIQVIYRFSLYCQNNKFSFILGIGTFPSVILGMIRPKKEKLIGCEHLSFNVTSFFWRILRRLFYPRLNAVTSLTNGDKLFLQRLNSNVFVIPNALTFNSSQRADINAKRFLSIGRFSPEKNFTQLIDIFNLFCKINSDWELRIIGEGKLQSELEQQIATLHLQNRISIHPYTDDIEKEYLSASVYVMTSLYEGLPMVLLESQSLGLPIISFDCPTGPRDIVIDGRNGYLIPMSKKTDELMVNILVSIASDATLRQTMSNYAIIDAQRFSPQKIYSIWDNLFDSL